MVTDHLARLLLDGDASTGLYTPHAFSLRLLGTELSTDHVVYLHEVHHAILNDFTAWGSALHVYARLPDDASQRFQPLLDACRITHESLATFASVQIAMARHGPLDKVLAAYPNYVRLYDALVRITVGVDGPNRRQLIASAMARLCMQTPVRDLIVAAGLDGFRLAAIADLDRPDTRWSWFLRQGPDLLTAASVAADRATVNAFGPRALASDGSGSDLYQATDRTHDEAWEFWEASAYEHLRAALATTRARTLGFNGHQDGTATLEAHARARYGDIGVRAARSDEMSTTDAAIASSILEQVRHDLAPGDRYRAALLPSTDASRYLEMLTDRPVASGQPAMIVDARPASRLRDLYRWPDCTPSRLPAAGEPVTAIRVIADDGGPDSVIGHVVVPDPEGLVALCDQWTGPRRPVFCISASCLADEDWAERWLPPVRSLGQLFLLVDVEPYRFVSRWVQEGREVTVVGIDISASGGQRGALLFTADDGVFWWLVVSDDVTVRLMIEYLHAQMGPGFRSELEKFGPIREDAIVAVSHLLATESFVSFDGLGAGRGR